MKKAKLLGFSLLILVVLLAILSGCMEFTLRYLDLKDSKELPYHGETGRYVPLIMKKNYRGMVAGVPITTNSYGLRDEPDFNPSPAANEFRILSVGDSIAFGLGVQASDCYAKVLGRRLNQAEGTVEYNVINAGGPGYSPSLYFLFLKNEALQWKPRMVLMEIELCNDVTDEALLRWEVDPAEPDRPVKLKGGRYVVAWDGILLSAYVRGPYFYERTYTYVELSRRLFDLLYRLRPTEPFHSDPSVTYYILGYDRYLLDRKRLEYGWEHLFRAIQVTHELLRAKHIDFLLMIMPSRYIYRPSAETNTDRFARGLVLRASAQARKYRIPYVDFTDIIGAKGGDTLYRDRIHLNEQGNQVVGNALFNHVKETLAHASTVP